jgi:hypothetical protein
MFKMVQKTYNSARSEDGVNWKVRGYIQLDGDKEEYNGEFDASEVSPYVYMNALSKNAFERLKNRLNDENK